MSKVLIILFSRGGHNYIGGNIVDLKKGNTEIVTNLIGAYIESECFRIRPVKEYSDDYMECTKQAQEEVRTKERPELREYLKSLDGYEDIIIAGPNWWGLYPMPVYSLLESLDFKGKNLYPVITHEGSGASGIIESLEKECSGATIKEALVIQGGEVMTSETIVREWADRNRLGQDRG